MKYSCLFLINNFRSYFRKISLALFVLCITSKSAFAQWSFNPAVNTPVCTAAYEQNVPLMISDGAGGAFLSWYDRRNGSDYNIYAQHVNADGVALWTANGATVCTHSENQSVEGMILDGAGGVIIVFGDNRNGEPDIYAQRLNASGVAQWTTNGVGVCTVPIAQAAGGVIPDGAGGAIIVWRDRRAGGLYDIYAQRINGSGASQWTTNGIPICTDPNEQDECFLVSDGSGGAIISWYDHRNGSYDIYAQRVNSSGVKQWTTNGLPVCTAANDQQSPDMVSDNAGGAIITWIDDRTDGVTYDVYAQRINGSGVAQWASNGIVVCNAPGTQAVRDFDTDGFGGMIVVWDDWRNGSNNMDIYAQRINGSGVSLWNTNGTAICTAPNRQLVSALTHNSDGGAVFTWNDERDYTGSGPTPVDIYAQRVNGAGAIQWAPDGVAVCTALQEQSNPDIVTDGAGGAIITWGDGRNLGTSDEDLYIQNIHSDGTLGPNPVSVNYCPSGNTTITSDLTGTTYQWQLNTGSGFANISDNSNYSGTNTITLQLNNVSSGWYGYIYRCIVNGSYSTNFKLKFADNWTGTTNTNWENPSNWSCSTIPDANTDVVISSGTIVINTNTTVRTLTLSPTANLTVAPGVTLTIIHQ